MSEELAPCAERATTDALGRIDQTCGADEGRTRPREAPIGQDFGQRAAVNRQLAGGVPLDSDRRKLWNEGRNCGDGFECEPVRRSNPSDETCCAVATQRSRHPRL